MPRRKMCLWDYKAEWPFVKLRWHRNVLLSLKTGTWGKRVRQTDRRRKTEVSGQYDWKIQGLKKGSSQSLYLLSHTTHTQIRPQGMANIRMSLILSRLFKYSNMQSFQVGEGDGSCQQWLKAPLQAHNPQKKKKNHDHLAGISLC